MAHRLRTRRSLRGAIGIVAGLLLVASLAALALGSTSNRSITGTQTVSAGNSATFTVRYDSAYDDGHGHYYRVTATVQGTAVGVAVTPAASTCVYHGNSTNHQSDVTVSTIAGTTPVGSYTVSTVLHEYAYTDDHCNGTNTTWALNSTLVVNKAVPAFSMSSIANKTFGDAPFNAVVSKPTGDTGAVTFSTGAGSHGCTVDPSTGLVTITGRTNGGEHCIISASLAADNFYAAAGPVTQQFHVNAGAPAFTFDLSALPAKAYGDPTFSVASYASKPADDAGAITFAVTERQPWLHRYRAGSRDDHRHGDWYQLLRNHCFPGRQRQLPRGRPVDPAVPHRPRHPCLHAFADRRQDDWRCSFPCRRQQARRRQRHDHLWSRRRQHGMHGQPNDWPRNPHSRGEW